MATTFKLENRFLTFFFFGTLVNGLGGNVWSDKTELLLLDSMDSGEEFIGLDKLVGSQFVNDQEKDRLPDIMFEY